MRRPSLADRRAPVAPRVGARPAPGPRGPGSRFPRRASRALAAFSALATLAGCRERQAPPDAAAPLVEPAPPPVAAEPPAPRLSYAGGSFLEVVAGARGAVVALRARSPVKSGPAAMLPGAADRVADVALGTGFLVEAKGPHVLTTERIASAAPEMIAVLVDGTELPAKVVGRDPRLDVGLLSVEAPAGARLPAMPLGDSDQLAVGEWLLVLGNPFGEEVTAAAGVVSATGRDAAASISPGSAMGFRTFVQTDARIHRGNSGGPALNTAGQVVGIATATSDRPTELSFVIPINRVREIVDSLRDTGSVTRAWLGAMVKPVTPQVAAQLGLAKPTGAWVTQVMPGSPAARSSLKVGDVITRWNDRDVDHRSLPWLVAGTAPGRPVRVVVWRARAQVELMVTTEAMPQ